MTSPSGQLIYREVQYFAPWLYVAVLATVIGGMASTLLASPPPDKVAIVVLTFALAVSAVLALPLRLDIEVRTAGIFVRLRPFWWTRLRLDGCIAHRPVTYSPIADYGGWGIRLRRGGRAYNARGNRGVRLEFENGTHILLGSQQPEQLDAAISQLFESGFWRFSDLRQA
jgi:hypothetical protein